MTKTVLVVVFGILFCLTLQSQEWSVATLKNKKIDVNARNTELVEVLSLIAVKSGLRPEFSQGIRGKISIELKNVSLDEALSSISTEHGLDYRIESSTLFVNKTGSTAFGSDSVKEIHLKYVSANEIAGKIDKFVETGEKIVVDERNNSLLFYGSGKTESRLRSFIHLFDRIPKQIVIESLIVETSKTFLRDIGFGWGTIDNPTLAGDIKTGGIINAPGPASPNLLLKKAVGSIDGSTLGIKLAAAESNGTATIISRPKVITLNNRTARIKSGITYHVKTLTAITGVSTGSSSPGGASGGASSSGGVSGGLQTVEAGLQLDVTPTLVGDDMVQMTIVMNNSTPDKGTGVDGIPGILSSSADTSVVVRQGHTAILAGLVKTIDSLTKEGVPFLANIPILGILFASHSEEKRNNEVVIFMTPLIISSPEELNQSEHMRYRPKPLHKPLNNEN